MLGRSAVRPTHDHSLAKIRRCSSASTSADVYAAGGSMRRLLERQPSVLGELGPDRAPHAIDIEHLAFSPRQWSTR